MTSIEIAWHMTHFIYEKKPAHECTEDNIKKTYQECYKAIAKSITYQKR